MSTTTIAEQISARFGDDGLNFRDREGWDLLCVLTQEKMTHVFNPGREAIRYIFADESVITVSGHAWDLGYLDCSCWQGAGHDDRYCEALKDETEE